MKKNNKKKTLKQSVLSLTGMLTMACLTFGFGLFEAQAQDPSASIYNAADGATVSELTVEPGETFTLTFGVESNISLNAVNISFSFDESILQIEEGSLTELAPENFNVPLGDAILDNENGYVFWEIGYISFIPPFEIAPPGAYDMYSLTFNVSEDLVFSTTTELMYDMDESFAGAGTQLLEASQPPFVVNITSDEPICDADGGIISFDNESNEQTICSEEDGLVEVVQSGAIGEAFAWILTDEDANALELLEDPPFDFSDTEPGTVLIWYLTFDPENSNVLELAEDFANGASLNADDLEGCFSLSNSIALTIETCEPECDVEGGAIAYADGSESQTICLGEGTDLDVTLEGEGGAEGTAFQWVITDADLNVLGLPEGPPFNFDGAGEGICLIWHLAFDPENSNVLEAVEAFNNGDDINAGNLEGCFDLSNSIEVVREVCCDAEGGTIAYGDGSDSQTICLGAGTDLDVTLDGQDGPEGTAFQWVITDSDLNVLGLPEGPPFNFDGAGEGICLIWHLAFDPENSNVLEAVEAFNNGDDINAGNLEGCFDLSNSIEVVREVCCDAEGGTIAYGDGSDSQTICLSEGTDLDVTLEGEGGSEGTAFQWVITDADLNVLGLPEGPPFNFDGAGEGTCLIWHLAFDPENSNVLEAAEAFANGAEINAGDLEGCFDLSNSIEVVRETCFDCPEQEANEGDACEVDGGGLGEINDNCMCVPVDVSDCNNFVVYLADIEPNGVTDVYGVSFNGSDADLSLIATSETEVHIAYNETNGLIYAVNKADGSYATLDPSTGSFGPLTMIDADVDEIIGAVINADGKLLLSSQSSNTIYSVNLPNSEVSVFDSYSPILGGDIAFGQDGMLYLATREGFGTLFEAYPDEVLADQFVGDLPSLVTGLALASNGQLLVSSRESGTIDVRNTDGSEGTPFNLMLDGESFESFNGDMASGCADNVPVEDDCNYALYYTHQPQGGDYSLLSVELNGGVANTTELLALGGGSSHIGLSPDGAFIYILGGQNVETYDVALGTIVNSVNVETAGGQNLSGFPAVVVAADGTLYAGTGNKIYSVDPATGIATQFGPNRNVNGGDLIEVAGELWIITRNNNTFTNVLTGASFTVPVNEINGAAVLENGNVLLADGNGEGLFKEVEIASQSVVAEYETGLELFNGDLAGGCTGGEDEDVCADTGECYGVTVDYVQGTTQGGGAIAAERANPMNALGEPEGTDGMVFTALGYGGSLTFQFDGVVPNGPGDDIEVVETSFNNPGCESYPEYADVSVSVDGSTYYYLGTVCKGDPFVDISDADVEIALECVSYVRVASNDELTSTGDGFDVDGIVALHNCDDGDDEETALTSVDADNTLTSFPNPTSGLSQAVFITAETERATLEVYDMNGRVVETLFNQVANANQEYRIDFDGMKLPNGVYVYRLTTDSETIVEKFMIAK